MGDGMTDPITVTYQPEWRKALWDKDVPSRPAWFVTCTEHEDLGRDQDGEPWGYATSGRARGTATRHRRTRHAYTGDALDLLIEDLTGAARGDDPWMT